MFWLSLYGNLSKYKVQQPPLSYFKKYVRFLYLQRRWHMGLNYGNKPSAHIHCPVM